MTDVVWVAILGVVGTLAAPAISQWMAARESRRTATHTARQAAEQESLQLQRDEAKTRAERLAANLREFWFLVLESQNRMGDLELVVANREESTSPTGFHAEAPTSVAARAYAVALLGLVDVRPLAKAFYNSTASLQLALESRDAERRTSAVATWRKAFDDLEKKVIDLVE